MDPYSELIVVPVRMNTRELTIHNLFNVNLANVIVADPHFRLLDIVVRVGVNQLTGEWLIVTNFGPHWEE